MTAEGMAAEPEQVAEQIGIEWTPARANFWNATMHRCEHCGSWCYRFRRICSVCDKI